MSEWCIGCSVDKHESVGPALAPRSVLRTGGSDSLPSWTCQIKNWDKVWSCLIMFDLRFRQHTEMQHKQNIAKQKHMKCLRWISVSGPNSGTCNHGHPIGMLFLYHLHKLKASQHWGVETWDSLDFSQPNHAFRAQVLGLFYISRYSGYSNQDLKTQSKWNSIIGHWKEALSACSGMTLPIVNKRVSNAVNPVIHNTPLTQVLHLKNRLEKP